MNEIRHLQKEEVAELLKDFTELISDSKEDGYDSVHIMAAAVNALVNSVILQEHEKAAIDLIDQTIYGLNTIKSVIVSGKPLPDTIFSKKH